MKCRALTQKGIRCKRNSDPNTNNYGFCKIHQYYSAVDTYWFNSLRELCPPINATIMEYIKFLDQFYVISPYFELHKITGATNSVDPTRSDPDKRDYLVSSQKLYNLGYHPSRSLEYGINQMLKFYDLLSESDKEKCRNY